jgi:hypothetical protein
MKIILGTQLIQLRSRWYPGLILLGKTRFYPTQVLGLARNGLLRMVKRPSTI